jgi:phosphate transport system permease protein
VGLRRAEDLKLANEVAARKAEIAVLEERYALLQAEAAKVTAGGAVAKLVAQDAAGREVVVPLTQVIRAWFPNRLDTWGRVKLYGSRLAEFIFDEPREANTEGGLMPAIFGTLVMTVFMSLLVTPFGVITAIYLREYAQQGAVLRIVRISVNNLAGVPSIVFGVFGLGFFVYVLGGTIDQLFFADQLKYNNNTPVFGTGGLLWCSLTLALMTLPVVIVATEEALAAVPRGMREASLATGASKWQTIRDILLPASAPGILTGVILAMARGAGEVAPLMLVGVVKLAPSLPFDGSFPFLHMDRKFMHLGFHVYDLGFQSPDSDAARPMVFATTLLLIILVVCLNLGAIWIRNRLRARFKGASF